MRVDAQTLQMSSFYVDEGSWIRPLSWSSTGDLLAILRAPSIDSDYLELCVITWEGVLQSCFEDKIVRFAFRERGQNYMVTWSEDGRYLYFVTDYGQYHRAYDVIESWGASLVEVDVATGKIHRMLYQTEAANQPPPMIYWTEDLHYLESFPAGEAPKVIDLWQNNELPLPQEIADMGHLMFCAQFSPQDQYLTARTYQDNVFSGFALVSPEGQLVQTLKRNALEQVGIDWADCPVWQSDDTAFYILGGIEAERSSSLYQYSLGDATLDKVKQIDPPDTQDLFFPINIPKMPISLAADNLTLAISFIAADTQTGIRVLSSARTWQAFEGTFSDGFSQGEYPIWFPPTESP
jgi:hypothetical protein